MHGDDEPFVVVLDVDGTLVDTNYHHAIAWHRALHDHRHAVQMWRIHRHIGMGGDQIVAALIGDSSEEAEGDAIREAHDDAYGELIGEVEPMAGAHDLIEELGDEGAKLVLASSAKREEVSTTSISWTPAIWSPPGPAPTTSSRPSPSRTSSGWLWRRPAEDGR